MAQLTFLWSVEPFFLYYKASGYQTGGKLPMAAQMFMRADEVAEVLGVSKPYAYKLIREMNPK